MQFASEVTNDGTRIAGIQPSKWIAELPSHSIVYVVPPDSSPEHGSAIQLPTQIRQSH